MGTNEVSSMDIGEIERVIEVEPLDVPVPEVLPTPITEPVPEQVPAQT
jgi:hypothetical protein